jgi:7-carboxy-7-deazaguanine synthase
MRVNEIFYSIQGESTFQGVPCVFVRLSGCNLRCSYCDTAFAYGEGDLLSIDEVLEKINEYTCRTVEITGGEPLLQKDCFELASRLIDSGYTVLIETNGTVDIAGLDRRVVKIIDIKCPGSGHSHEVMWENLELLSEGDEIKFVVSSRDDYEWASEIIVKKKLAERYTVLLSPAYGTIEPGDLASWILEDGMDVRMNLQLHKYIWDPDERGR